jgi:phosphatidylglycerophosphatase C
MKQNLALFDFDGTITTTDSLFRFIRYYKGKLHYQSGILLLFPVFILYLLKIIPNWRAKEIVLMYFFRNEPVNLFQQKCKDFAVKELPSIIKTKALETIENHQKSHDRVIIVSASPEIYLASWCQSFNIELIGTRLEIKNNRITGKIKGKNCHGVEKVSRIKEILSLDDYNDIYAYGDSRGDKAMLQLATHAYYQSL